MKRCDVISSMWTLLVVLPNVFAWVLLQDARLDAGSRSRPRTRDDNPTASQARAIEDNLYTLLSKGVSTSVGFSDGIETLLNKTLIPAIYKGLAADHNTMYKGKQMFQFCETTREAFLKPNKTLTKNITKLNGQLHSCRMSEAVLAESANACTENKKALKTIADTECESMKMLEGQFSTLATSCKRERTEDYGMYITRNSKVFNDQLTSYQTFKQHCTGSSAKHVEKSKECAPFEKNHSSHRLNCTNTQRAYEVAVCTEILETRNVNKQYTKCYNQAAMNLLGVESLLRQKEKLRYDEWGSIKRIQCLLKVLAIKDTLDAAAQNTSIEECKTKEWDMVHMQLQYFKAPMRKSDIFEPSEPCARIADKSVVDAPNEKCLPCRQLVNIHAMNLSAWTSPADLQVAPTYKSEEGTCLTDAGQEPKFKWHAASSWVCQDLCNKNKNCTGFSAKLMHSDCLLWLETGIKGGGGEWNHATCKIKEAQSQ